jgi:hydrogenase nickel incorporation protein HypA/HybF
MHELTLMKSVIAQLEAIVARAGGTRALSVTVRLGALSHISADHFREHFEEAIPGTSAEGARLLVNEDRDPRDPAAQDVVIESVSVEVED